MEFSSFGAVSAQVIATLFVAAVISDGFLKVNGQRQIWVRVTYIAIMALGLFAGLYAATGADPNEVALVLMIVGAMAGIGAVISAQLDDWMLASFPNNEVGRNIGLIVIVVVILFVPALILTFTVFGNVA